MSPKRAKESKEKFCFDNLLCSVIELLCSGFDVHNVYYIHQAIEENEIKDERLIKISIFEYENEQNRISTDFLCA